MPPTPRKPLNLCPDCSPRFGWPRLGVCPGDFKQEFKDFKSVLEGFLRSQKAPERIRFRVWELAAQELKVIRVPVQTTTSEGFEAISLLLPRALRRKPKKRPGEEP